MAETHRYLAEVENLCRNCPEQLKGFMGNQFVAEISDDANLDMVQLYLSQFQNPPFNASMSILYALQKNESGIFYFALPIRDTVQTT